MKVTLLNSAVSAGTNLQFTTSFIINDTVAIDAGCLGFHGDPRDQVMVRHVLISHTHVDHIASLPIYVENCYEGKADCVSIYGSASVIDCLRKDIFNDRVWPDFVALSPPGAPFMKLVEIESYKPLILDGLRITPVPVDHVVPTHGFIISDGKASIIIVGDTGPTHEIWKYAQAEPNLKAVFLEVTFPDSMTRISELSKHLTPTMLAAEMRKVTKPTTFYTVHLKARFHDQVIKELHALQLPNMKPVEFEKPYQF